MEDSKITYSKPILSKSDFIQESGYPEDYVERALHCRFSERFVIKKSTAPNAKRWIDTVEFEYWRRQGAFN